MKKPTLRFHVMIKKGMILLSLTSEEEQQIELKTTEINE